MRVRGCSASSHNEAVRRPVSDDMNTEQRRRARDLFEAALEHEPSDVLKWLAAVAPDDSIVRAEVLSLLEHHSRAGAFLIQPAAEAAPHLLEEEHTLEPGTVLGSYTVMREIGRGGMGRVYLASDSGSAGP